MPKLDGTGPQGQGHMTGRGMGSCEGGRGKRFGRFGRVGFFSRKNELRALEEEKEALADELEVLKEEIDALKESE